MMKNPVIALTWRCWRMTMRWYLLIMAIAVAVHLALLNIPAPRNMPPQLPFREVMANGAFVVNMTLAIFTTLLAISVGGRAGFPLRFEFRLPANTTLLVMVPLLYLGAACASLYIVPALLGWGLYGIPFPLLPAAVLIAFIVVALAAASWSTTGNSARAAAAFVAFIGLLEVAGRMKPFHMITTARPGEPLFNPDSIAFTGADYAVLALLMGVLSGFTIYRVRLQRCSETWGLALPAIGASPRSTGDAVAGRRGSSIDWIGDLISIPCPVGSAWSAELWFEFKRHGLPVLALGLVLALALPLVLLGGRSLGWSGMGNVGLLPPIAVFFTGIGIAFFNRRVASNGYMNAFEATRALGTLHLAGAQFLVAGVSTLAGIALTLTSLLLSISLMDQPGSLIDGMRQLVESQDSASLSAQGSDAVVALTLYFSFLALLAFMHACSVFWGRKVFYAMMVFVLYCIGFIFRVAGNYQQVGGSNVPVPSQDALATIQHHMWGFAVLVVLATLVATWRVLHLKLLSTKTGIASLLVWAVFAVCTWMALQNRDIHPLYQPHELQALNAALLVLPLLLFLLTAWSYDKLRHR